MFDQIHQKFSKGVSIQDHVFYQTPLVNGRMTNEEKTTIYIKKNKKILQIMDVIYFSGIKPWYHPWIEMVYSYDFNRNENNFLNEYFNTAIEKTIIKLFCDSLPPAGKIFISYDVDEETRKELLMNIPEVITRLGFLLFTNGCTWFKDWYFPEGGFEGCQKLQGEKPINPKQKIRQLDQLEEQVSNYLVIMKTNQSLSIYEKYAVSRGKEFLQMLD